jgi:hypothetical protein
MLLEAEAYISPITRGSKHAAAFEVFRAIERAG